MKNKFFMYYNYKKKYACFYPRNKFALHDEMKHIWNVKLQIAIFFFEFVKQVIVADDRKNVTFT